MKRIFAVLLCSVLILGGCSILDSDTTEEYISKQIGIDFNEDNGYLDSMSSTHGGFLGDGDFIAIYTFEDNSVEEQIKSNEHWSNSASINTSAIMYGSANVSRFFEDENGNNVFPVVKNGYYYFYDRHSDADDPYSSKDIFDRYSYNFTIALYDCDTDTLYFAELDT